MFCCIITCIFLTNVLHYIRKRFSAKLLDGGTRHGRTLSQPAHNVEQPSARQRNVIRMFEMLYNKKRRKEGGGKVCVWGGWGGEGGGVGDRLESHIETHSIFVVFYCICCCCFCTVGGGVNN